MARYCWKWLEFAGNDNDDENSDDNVNDNENDNDNNNDNEFGLKLPKSWIFLGIN